MGDPHKVAAVFDDWADRGRAEGMERGHALAARTGFDWLDVGSLGEGARYLDIGCGNGYSVRWAAEAAPDIEAVGIDVSAHMIERAREQSASVPHTWFVHGVFPSDELSAAAFDRVLSMEVFYYLPDLARGLAATRELLRPGGRFVCIVDHYRENEASHSWGPDMDLSLHLLTEAQWRTAFEDAGFASIEQRRVRQPSVDGEPDSWKQTEGSLLTCAFAS